MFDSSSSPFISVSPSGRRSVGASWLCGSSVNLRLLCACLSLVLLALSPARLGAQSSSTGAISGTVLDAKGGVIVGAQVTVISQSTGETARQVTSGAAGTFNVALLPPATYRVEITANGFSKFAADNVVVRVTETASVQATLQVGTVTSTISVTSAEPPVNLTSATTGQTISSETVSTLPLSTRNFLTLLTLSAGANTELFDNAALGRGQVSMDVNGQRPANNNYQLEGINANDFNLPINDNVALPNPETVEEFKTQTSLYDASQGRNGGGVTQVDLKSGTNEYHGNAYEFFRNEDFNANNWFLNDQGQPRPILRQNQFGSSFGGPVPKVKNFFFFLNYQGTRETSGTANGTLLSTTVPVLPADRSEANLVSTFFPSGLPASASALDPTALKWLNLPASKCPGFNDGTFCIPSLPGTPGVGGTAGAPTINTATITRSLPGKFQDDQFVTTVDKQISANDKLSGRVFFSDNSILYPFSPEGGSLALLESLPGSNRFIKVGWTRTIGSSMVNDFRFGFSRYTFDQSPTEPITLSDIGASRPNESQVPAAYQLNVSGGGSFSLGTGANEVRSGAFNTFVIGDDFSIIHGKHSIRFGGEWDKYQLNRTNAYASRGVVTFTNSSAGAFAPSDPALTAFQNFLLGRVQTTSAQAGFDSFHFRDADPALYIQDDWRITQRLTLNLGLRWEGISQSHETNNQMSNFRGLGDGLPGPVSIIYAAGAPGGLGTPGISNCTLLHCMDKKDFAPRVGFAWDAFGDQKTVVRGGFGIYYDRISNQSILESAGGFPFNETIQASPYSVTPQDPFAGLPPNSAFPLSFKLVLPQLTAFDGSTGAPIFSGGNGSTNPNGSDGGFYFYPVRNLHAPYSEQWNFGIERQLAGQWVLELNYVGTHGVDLLGTGAPLDAAQICTAAGPCTIPASIASGVTVPAGTPYVTKNGDGSVSITGSTFDNLDARVPPQYLGIQTSGGFFTAQAGNSIYHSLQATLSHQFSNGLYFQGAYTWSHSIDNGSGSTFQDELDGLTYTVFGDYLNSAKTNRATSDFDRTHRFVFSYDYELPFGKWTHLANEGFKGRLVNGWQINGVTTFQSGTPFTVYDGSTATLQDLNFFNGTNFATLAPGKTLKDALTHGSVESRVNNYIDQSAFLLGGNCVDSQNTIVSCSSPDVQGAAIGNVGRNTFRGPFQQNWDMSLVKNTKITERTSVDFRVEAFNVFNHPSFASPQSGFATGFNFLGNYGYVNLANGSTAILNTVSTARILQLALKLNF
jgi:Carboxypeptidase regulatory-like domain